VLPEFTTGLLLLLLVPQLLEFLLQEGVILAAEVGICEQSPDDYSNLESMSGCVGQFSDFLDDNETVIMWCTIGAIVVMCLNVLFAIMTILKCC